MSRTLVREITLVPVGDVEPDLLEYLAMTLPCGFDANVRVLPTHLSIAAAYNSTRQQYHSTQLLQQLHELGRHVDGKLLGVTELDLFIPIFTFVFGEAQVGGPVALMSAHRLRQEFYGLPADRDLLLTRVEKEAIHELGHAWGLTHCRSYDCVMRFSNSVEEVDVKANEFCRPCTDKLWQPCDSTLAA